MKGVRQSLSMFGAGGLGKELLSWLKMSPDWEPVSFFDDVLSKGTTIKGIPVVGDLLILKDLGRDTNLIIAVGDPQIKRRVAGTLSRSPHIQYPAVVHPGARLEDPPSIIIGAGSVITAGCILTTDIKVGDHVLINLSCTIGHDTKIGDFTSIMPGASIAGQVTIGNAVMIGSGAILNNGVSIGDGARVGAGAVVISDVPANCTVVGVPAKPIDKR